MAEELEVLIVGDAAEKDVAARDNVEVPLIMLGEAGVLDEGRGDELIEGLRDELDEDLLELEDSGGAAQELM